MNRITIIGNLTKDPVQKATPNGKTVTQFGVAVNDGDNVTYFSVNVWEKLAEICYKYLAKGKKVAVVGKIKQREYDGKDGEKKAYMEITANEVEFLSPKTDKADDDFKDVSMEDCPF